AYARSAARQISLANLTLGHAPAEFLDQLACGDAGRRQHHTGLFHPARNRETAETLALMASLAGHPVRALLDKVADPEQRFDVLLQRRAAEQADMCDIRRAVARQAAL